MGDIGDAYAEWAAMQPRKCICGEHSQGHPSGLCDACVAKRSASERARRLGAAPAPTPPPAPGLDLDAVERADVLKLAQYAVAVSGTMQDFDSIEAIATALLKCDAEVRALRAEVERLRTDNAEAKRLGLEACQVADGLLVGGVAGFHDAITAERGRVAAIAAALEAL